MRHYELAARVWVLAFVIIALAAGVAWFLR